MRSRLIVAVATVVALLGGAGAAEAAWYWCDPLHAYYPWVRSCPAAWQPVNPWSASQQPGAPPPQPSSSASASPGKPGEPGPQPAADQGDLPTFAPPGSLARGDALDAWCKGKTTALNIAVCSDGELRALAIERLRAFDEARARLGADQVKTLAADQNGWAMSYPQSCGLHSTAAPALPLDPSLRDCLAEAGRARLAYLRAFGTPGAAGAAAASAAAAPGTAVAEPPPPTAASPAAASAAQAPAQPPAQASDPAANPAAKSAAAEDSGSPLIRIPPVQLPAAAQSPSGQAPATPPPAAQAPAARSLAAQRGSPFKPGNANPLIVDGPAPWRTGATVGAILIALGCVGLWVLGVLQRLRTRRDKAAAPPA
jgi:hypothetical protein